jgi:hypothetical protein
VNIAGIVLGGADAANYTLLDTTARTTADIAKAPLTVTANDASKVVDGQPYPGGNGVTYSGFVAGETAGVLAGTLAWSGSAQGAVAPGRYVITAGGQTAVNYQILWVDGQLTVSVPAALNAQLVDVVPRLSGLAGIGTSGLSGISIAGLDGASGAASVGAQADAGAKTGGGEAGASLAGSGGGEVGASADPCRVAGRVLLRRPDGKLVVCEVE